jgi:hypothetical protein
MKLPRRKSGKRFAAIRARKAPRAKKQKPYRVVFNPATVKEVVKWWSGLRKDSSYIKLNNGKFAGRLKRV